MTTMLEKNIEKLETKYGIKVEIVNTGVTGGFGRDGFDQNSVVFPKERSNAAAVIKKIGDKKFSTSNHSIYYELPAGYYLVTGAGYGGSKGLYAKQCHYAIVKEI